MYVFVGQRGQKMSALLEMYLWLYLSGIPWNWLLGNSYASLNLADNTWHTLHNQHLTSKVHDGKGLELKCAQWQLYSSLIAQQLRFLILARSIKLKDRKKRCAFTI